MIQVLISDDHPLVRNGVSMVLAQEPDFSPPGEAENSEQALSRVREKNWDLVILDIGMPGRSGLETLSEIKKLRPGLPVLILSMHSEEQFAIRAIRAGASGYITKNDAPSELLRAVRKILSGRKYVSSALAEVLANAIEAGDERPSHEVLSNREYNVVCALAAGKTVSEIAAETFLSVKTVSTYRTRALDKMNMRNNAELTRYAIRNGLVD